jgi:hypothetical protein
MSQARERLGHSQAHEIDVAAWVSRVLPNQETLPAVLASTGALIDSDRYRVFKA